MGHTGATGSEPGRARPPGTDPPGGAGAVDNYLAVTVVCADRRLDVALPSTVPWADLQPALLRLTLAHQPTDPGRWSLTPIGRSEIDAAQTLADAGVLTADVLVLHQSTGPGPAAARLVDSVRDRTEDLVDGRERFWGHREARRLALWAATAGGAVLLVPAVLLGPAVLLLPAARPVVGAMAGSAGGGPAGPAVPAFGGSALAATVALIVALIAVLAARSGETACATIGMTIACGWAVLAGGLAVAGGPAYWGAPIGGAAAVAGAATAGVDGSGAGPPLLALMLAAGAAAALLLAGCCVAGYPAALGHTAALLVVTGAALAVAVAARLGAPTADAAAVSALAAVLLIGLAPRVTLAVSGVRDTTGAPADLDRRINRADRLLTGAIAGLSLVTITGALPAAMSSSGWQQLFALGIGGLLMLRSRLFSQVPHVLPARIGALAVLAELWAGRLSGDPALLGLLILGPVVLLALMVAAVNLVTAASPVARARAARAMDLTELALVVGLVVLLAGSLGLSGWLTSVVG